MRVYAPIQFFFQKNDKEQHFVCALQYIEVQKSSEIAPRVPRLEQRACICTYAATTGLAELFQESNCPMSREAIMARTAKI